MPTMLHPTTTEYRGSPMGGADESVYRSRPIKRHRRSRDEMQTIREGLYQILEQDHPQTIRGLFYQAVTRGLVPKTEAAYKNTVIRLMGDMRKDGIIPYEWVADNTRWMRRPTAYGSAEDALLQAWQYYRLDIWAHLPDYVEVWCEKDALAGVLYEETSEWCVPLMVTRGYPSLSYLHESGEYIEGQAKQGKTTYIYYFGDLDPTGVDISENTQRGLEEYSGDAQVIFQRIAVTHDQVEELNLPTRPTKTTDSRAKTWEGDSVELDAIPAHILKAMVRGYILSHIPEHTRDHLTTVEQNERAALHRIYELTKGATI